MFFNHIIVNKNKCLNFTDKISIVFISDKIRFIMLFKQNEQYLRVTVYRFRIRFKWEFWFSIRIVISEAIGALFFYFYRRAYITMCKKLWKMKLIFWLVASIYTNDCFWPENDDDTIYRLSSRSISAYVFIFYLQFFIAHAMCPKLVFWSLPFVRVSRLVGLYNISNVLSCCHRFQFVC